MKFFSSLKSKDSLTVTEQSVDKLGSQRTAEVSERGNPSLCSLFDLQLEHLPASKIKPKTKTKNNLLWVFFAPRQPVGGNAVFPTPSPTSTKLCVLAEAVSSMLLGSSECAVRPHLRMVHT